MAQRTAQGFRDIFFDPYGGVRGLADVDNFEISSWYNEDSQLRKTVNILSVDYFASSDVVELCKSINLERASRKKILPSRTLREML